MRPRPDAAENGGGRHDGLDLRAGASMRPRPDAAENVIDPALSCPLPRASMRPRPDAAENDAFYEREAKSEARLQ